MPLTNTIIIKLNEITNTILNKNSLNSEDENFIKTVFKNILKEGETYDVAEIESWFKNEGSWKNQKTIIRITNMSHYIQHKHEQTSNFKILTDDQSCNCDNE